MCSAISKIGLSLSGLMTVCQFGVYKFVAVVQDEDVDDDEDEVEDDCFVNDNEDATMMGAIDDGVAGGEVSAGCGGGVDADDGVNVSEVDEDVGCMKEKEREIYS